MKLVRLYALLLCAGSLLAQGNRMYVPGQILVQERRNVDPGLVVRTLNQLGTKIVRRIPQTAHDLIGVPDQQVPSVIEALKKTGLFTIVERDGLARGSGTPNDPNYASQWHLPAIQAPTAWNTTIGSSSQVIAIVDSGVDPTHPDLTSQLVPGWNYVFSNADTHDVYGHGTAVAGTAAAATNNSIGVAGVSWSARVMPIVVLDSNGSASYSNIASGIMYAADHGARIINVSIGGSVASSTLQSAVDYAWNKGAVVFASAMNNSSSTPYYPAACNHVASVSATDVNGVFASFSNFGSTIDLSAPGNNILTTTNGGGYGYWYGTSFSSPIAAGVGALALSVNPSLTADALVNLLEQNADDLGTPGYDIYFGFGQVNAARAVAAASKATAPPPAVSIAYPSTNSSLTGNVTVSGTVSTSQSGAEVDLYCDNQFIATGTSLSFSLPWNSASVPAGTHTLLVKAIDSLGNAGSSSISVVTLGPSTTTTDTAAPLVRIVSPTAGSVLKNVVSIQGSATDNVGVVQLCIYIDGVQVYNGSSSSFSYNWNTKKATRGNHVVSVTAWDGAGHSGSANVSVTI